MSEQRLNHANVLAALEQMGRKTVAKRMQRDRLAQRRGFGGLLEQSTELTRSHRLMLTAAWKQPVVFGRDAVVGCVRPRLPPCLLYTSDAADDLTRVDLGGRR